MFEGTFSVYGASPVPVNVDLKKDFVVKNGALHVMAEIRIRDSQELIMTNPYVIPKSSVDMLEGDLLAQAGKYLKGHQEFSQ